MADPEKTKQTIHVAVRELAESVYRRGGLSLLSYRQLSGRTGTRTHQAFAARLHEEYLQFDIKSELPLSHAFPIDERFGIDGTVSEFIETFEVSGRADALLLPITEQGVVSFNRLEKEPEIPFIVEVKTVAGGLEKLPEKGETVHRQQARLYTYLYWLSEAERGKEIPENIAHALAYVSAETLEARFLLEEEKFSDLEAWFFETCRAYLNRARQQASRIRLRDEGIAALRFPYPKLREGQDELIRSSFEAIRRRTPLLVQALTGTGKTMSVLFPAVKALALGELEHIFYLTAKTSTRRVAEQALDDLRAENSLNLRSLTLAAKESICLAPELYCDTGLCPYAVHYYDNLPAALDTLRPIRHLNPEILSAVGESQKVCPFELSLDAAGQCDVIIGDYNHAFDPRIQLERFFGEKMGHQIILLDEAHNLVDRSREMYSATLEASAFKEFGTIFPEGSYAFRLNEAVLAYFAKLEEGIKKGEEAWNQLESAPAGESMRILVQGNFRAVREPLNNLSELLVPWLRHMRERIEDFNEPKLRRRLIELISQVKFFTRITDEFWSDAYIACCRLTSAGLALRLICLDVSEKLSETYINRHASVFFSATLSPLSYFSVNFCGRNRDNRPDTLRLPSPFPPENLQVISALFIPTVYRRRQDSAADLAKALALAVLLKQGQQFIFFPSFAYMDLVLPLLKTILNGRDIEWQIQKRRMGRRERELYLKAFEHPEPGRTLVGVAVLGGIFSEGIDLVGDKLSGVSIVGVGLPQLSPERNLMREYYDEVYQGGFQYAYLYPGMNKVLQAAGRLIRSEEDKGFLLLLDERYGRPDYRGLLPEEWQIEEAHSLRELKTLLEERNPGTP